MIGECFLCHKTATLECHHIFGGSRRKKSEKYKLKVHLCVECHRGQPNGVHHNKDKMQYLHEFGQHKAMFENDWTIDEFRQEFNVNYI